MGAPCAERILIFNKGLKSAQILLTLRFRWLFALQQFREQAVKMLRAGAARSMLDRELSTLFGQAFCQALVALKPLDCRRDLFRCIFVDQEPGFAIPNRIGNATATSGDDGYPRKHGLRERQALCLAPAIWCLARRADEHVGRRQVIRHRL